MVNVTNSNQVEKGTIVHARISGKHGKLVTNPNPLIRQRVQEKNMGQSDISKGAEQVLCKV